MKRLELLRDEIDKCVRCGTCRATCPTTKALGIETASPRGRVSLVDAYSKNEIGFTSHIIGTFTEAFDKLKKGDKVGIRGPYGKGFQIKKGNEVKLLTFADTRMFGKMALLTGWRF